MKSKRGFGEGPLFVFASHVMTFFIYNLYFLAVNVLLGLYVLTYGFVITPESKYVLVLAFLPLGPAMTALYSSMGRLVREGDLPKRDYFCAYRANFIPSMKAWSLLLALLFLFYIDIQFFKDKSYGLFFVPVFQVLILLLVLSSFYLFPLITRFQLKTKDVFKTSLYYVFSYFKATLFFAVLILMEATLFTRFPGFAIPFIFSIHAYVVMFSLNQVLKKTEDHIIVENE